MIYIPFVKDSQNFVNASLIIKTTATDTSFKFLHGSQYDDYGFDTLKTGVWNARNVFHILANLDRNIFGTKKYRILDNRIFNGDTSIQPIVTFIDEAPNTGGRTSLMEPITVCNLIRTCGQCLAFKTSATATDPYDPCCFATYNNVCTTYWIEIGGGGTGGGGGGGGTGGGGGGGGTGGGGTGGGGGWTGDPCPPPGGGGIYPRIAVNEPTDPPCGGTGWVPVPIDDKIYFDYSNLENPIYAPENPLLTTGPQVVDVPAGTPQNPPMKMGHTRNRFNVEDMDYGFGGTGPFRDPSGIYPFLLTDTDNQLFDKMTNLFYLCTFFDNSLKNVGNEMIQKFRDRTGGTYSHPELNGHVNSSPEIANFIKKYGIELNKQLLASGNNINNVPDFEIAANQRPVFNGSFNKFNGLQILINDTEFTEIEIDNFEYWPATKDWIADITVTVHDHFGLDKHDALTYQGSHLGFGAWWILQHLRGYRTFETIVKVKKRIIWKN
jgi:Protein of unknown function (DUF3289)